MTRVYSSLIYAGLVICPKSGARRKLTTYDNICPQLGYNRNVVEGTDTVGGRSTSAVAGVKLDVLD